MTTAPLAFQRMLDTAGLITSGATLSFYTSGTTTPLAVFTSPALSVSLGATLTADSGGRFSAFYCDPALSYKAVLAQPGSSVTFDPFSSPLLEADSDPTLTAIANLDIQDGDLIVGTGDDTVAAVLVREVIGLPDTYVVASSTASAAQKRAAQYVCTGTGDETIMKQPFTDHGYANIKVIYVGVFYVSNAGTFIIDGGNNLAVDMTGAVLIRAGGSADTMWVKNCNNGSVIHCPSNIVHVGAGSALRLSGNGGFTNCLITSGEILGAAHAGRGVYFDATAKSQTTFTCRLGSIHGFDKGVARESSGGFIQDTILIDTGFVYDNNTDFYCRSSGAGVQDNACHIRTNVDAYINSATAIDTDGAFDVWEVILGAQAPSPATTKLIWLRSGAKRNQFRCTPHPYVTFGTGYVQDDSGRTDNTINGVAFSATSANRGQLLKLSTTDEGVLVPTAGVPGTTTNDNAAAGLVGEIISATTPNTTATVTIAIASPGVISWAAHGFTAGTRVNFTTTGALPTGITSGTPYYVISAGLAAGAFQISATPEGTPIVTTGSQSGTHTGTSVVNLTTGTPADLAALYLTAGDWDVWGAEAPILAGGTTVSFVGGWISSVSATFPSLPNEGAAFALTVGLSAGGTNQFPVGQKRVSVASPTPIYLSTQLNFATSTAKGSGYLAARRVR